MYGKNREPSGSTKKKYGINKPNKSSSKPVKALHVVKPKKDTRRTTQTTKNHRFQPFSERIAKLRIDPIRRKRHADDHEGLTEETATYFGRRLEEWKDLNLSATFTSFAKEVTPLCDSLPMVIYHADALMDIMMSYIERGDELGMEPLLDLLAKFAQDLDVRFETYFARSVSTVTAVAAKHQDPAVVEWSFTCLAWLFKYLSRLLAPNLRPLYDLMAPYLGKEHQRPFIVRFTAESMGFLVRKAAALYEKNQKPLDSIISYMVVDCVQTERQPISDLYRQGVMTTLVEAVKGIQTGLHSLGLGTVRSMAKACQAQSGSQVATDIAVGVLTSLIHHTDSETFAPILAAILKSVTESKETSEDVLRFQAMLIFTVVSVRKGSRVGDWKAVMGSLKHLVDRANSFAEISLTTASPLLSALAVTIQYATFDAILPAHSLLQTVRGGKWARFFLQFCDFTHRLGQDRFKQFLLPESQKFISAQWEEFQDELLAILPRLNSDSSIALNLPTEAMEVWLERFDTALTGTSSEEELVNANEILRGLRCFKTNDAVKQRLTRTLELCVRKAFDEPESCSQEYRAFALSVILENLLQQDNTSDSIGDLFPALCQATSEHASSATFLRSLRQFCDHYWPLEASREDLARLRGPLVDSLASPSHEIREASLEVLMTLQEREGLPVPAALSTMNAIESTSISLASSRAISMDVRRLAVEFETLTEDWMRQAVPTYCFGLLHLQLSQAWDEAIDTLVKICQHSEAEGAVTELAQAWLETTPVDDDQDSAAQPLDVETQGWQVMSDFECTNYEKLSAISKQVFEESDAGFPSAEAQLQIALKQTPRYITTSRSQALRVLDKAPQLAEKRSRMLVPILLRWAGNTQDDDGAQTGRWNRKDQKAMLAIFAKFTNPKVLYKSVEVYDALLNLCANGDVDIQRSSLKAIFSWKQPGVNRYEEHLLNLLDEARFRDELSVFLQQGDSEGSIRPEDLPVLVPVMLRVLFGRAIAGGNHTQGARRRAIFVALAKFGQETLDMFVNIAISSIGITSDGLATDSSFVLAPNSPPRQQIGMLNMLGDMLDTLAGELEPSTRRILHAVMKCTINASKNLDMRSEGKSEDESLYRSIRQAGVQCLVLIFREMKDVVMLAEAQATFDHIVASRLQNFAKENLQSVSGILRLLSTWSASPLYAQFLRQATILPQLVQLLRDPQAKDSVRIFVLEDIVDPLAQHGGSEVSAGVLEPHVSEFVQAIGEILPTTTSKDVLDVCVRTLTLLAGKITDPAQASALLSTCSSLLTKPSKVVSPRTKVGLLNMALPLLALGNASGNDMYVAVSGLFSRTPDNEGRALLCRVLSATCKNNSELDISAGICADLNAFTSRLDEPDHDRREQGFAKIVGHAANFTPTQWLPILHNCLFYLRDIDDLVNRSSAGQGLARFIDVASLQLQDFKPLLGQTLLPSVERGMQVQTELIRAEYLRLLGRLVEKLPAWQALSDMNNLAVGGNEEASFFINALHIQQHRRLRALKRLAEEAPTLTSSNITKYFLPLLEHFVLDPAEGDAGRNLMDHAVTTISALAGSLTESAFRATFKRYAGYVSTKEELEKTVLRLLGGLVDALAAKSGDEDAKRTKSSVIINEFLPPLTEYLHRKDESTVDRRMPVAVTIVKLLLLLPEQEIAARLPPVLTDVSQVLRSRSQEARDQTRKTLASILSLIGPQYLGFMLRELRGALRSGYQLHVLSFTVHSLLVNVTATCQPGDLDHCLPDLTSIIMDDIFGITGQEKDAEEYKSGMKEVKSSKSYDTMELLARVTPIGKLGFLLQPLRALLVEKLDAKAAKKIDDLLTRLRKGVDQNEAADSRDMLIFCHEIVRQVNAERNAAVEDKALPAYKVRKYLIQMESANKSKSRGATTSQLFKLSTFALNLVRKVVRTHADLLTPANMAGFLPMIGDALVGEREEVKLSAMRLLATIIKVPLAQIDRNAPVYMKEAVAIMKGAANMTTDAAKAALELVTAILRERRSVEIKETDIATVVRALRTDVDEPDRQGIIYKFLRAVLGRKIVITEVYQIMDEVGKVMVTNPDHSIRDSARGVYLQFVMDYPQGKERWNKHAGFLVENLKYPTPAGRGSVMEFLNQLLKKISDEVFAQLAKTFFVSLVLVQADDQDAACRQFASMLVAELFKRADVDQMNGFLTLVNGWLGHDKKAKLQIAALQCWTIYLRSCTVPRKQADQFRDNVASVFESEDVVVGPELLAALLDSFTVLVELATESAFSAAASIMWTTVQQCLATPDERVRGLASRLTGDFFSHLASGSAQGGDGLAALPLKGSGGLSLDAVGMRHVCITGLQAVMGFTVATSEETMASMVRNLGFLGRCFAANKMRWEQDSLLTDRDPEEEGSESSETDARQSALEYLLHQLSYIIRQENLPLPARSAAIQCQAILVKQLASIPNLSSILRPLYLLSDSAITQATTAVHKELADKARELMESIQKNVGSEAYISALGEARRGAQAKREERRRKRKIEAVNAPEKWAAAKKRKHEMQNATKKARNSEMRGKRRGW